MGLAQQLVVKGQQALHLCPNEAARNPVGGMAAEVQHHLGPRYSQVHRAPDRSVGPVDAKAQPLNVKSQGLGVIEDAKNGRYQA